MASVGRYELLRKLGAGALSEVHLARAAGPGGVEKMVALKCIAPSAAEDLGFINRFHNEIRTAARLDHPHVVQIFDFGAVDGQYFVAMEHVDGPSLRQLLDRERQAGRSLPLNVALRIAAHVCDALVYVHGLPNAETGERLGAIHRDVTPTNILVSTTGTVKLGDFGLVRATDPSRTFTIAGDVAYLAPELVSGRGRHEQSSDLYALGIVLYEMVTGATPFTGESLQQRFDAILRAPLVPAAALRPDVPKELDALFDKALAKSVEERFPSAEALRDAIEAVLASLPALSTTDFARFVQDAPGLPVSSEFLSTQRLPPRAVLEQLRAPWQAPSSSPAASTTAALQALEKEEAEEERRERPLRFLAAVFVAAFIVVGLAALREVQEPTPPPPADPAWTALATAPRPPPPPPTIVVEAPPERTPTPPKASPAPSNSGAVSAASASASEKTPPKTAAGHRASTRRGPPPPASALALPGPREVRITAMIRGVPTAARVNVQGTYVGDTPHFLRREPGVYHVRLDAPNVDPAIFEVIVSKDRGGQVDVELDMTPPSRRR